MLAFVNDVARRIFVHGIKLRYYAIDLESWLPSYFFAKCFQLDWPTAHYRFQGRLELSVNLHRTSGNNVKISVSLRYHVRIQWAICASSLIFFFSRSMFQLGLILLADALLLGAQKLGPLLQELRSHWWDLSTTRKVLRQCFVLLRVSVFSGLFSLSVVPLHHPSVLEI